MYEAFRFCDMLQAAATSMKQYIRFFFKEFGESLHFDTTPPGASWSTSKLP